MSSVTLASYFTWKVSDWELVCFQWGRGVRTAEATALEAMSKSRE